MLGKTCWLQHSQLATPDVFLGRKRWKCPQKSEKKTHHTDHSHQHLGNNTYFKTTQMVIGLTNLCTSNDCILSNNKSANCHRSPQASSSEHSWFLSFIRISISLLATKNETTYPNSQCSESPQRIEVLTLITALTVIVFIRTRFSGIEDSIWSARSHWSPAEMQLIDSKNMSI